MNCTKIYTLNLTVVIPTYNRRKELIRLLRSFLAVKYELIDEFVISDNHSDYNIYESLKEELPLGLLKKCRIVINTYNIGGQGNINNSFLLAKTKWMWMIGDDDVITNDAVDVILENLEEDPNCAWFKYSTPNIDAFEDDCVMNSLHDFINYYTVKKRHKGNLVFMSNNVYNMQALSSFVVYAFDYSYTFVSQILPPLMGLDSKSVYVKYVSKSICEYTVPENEHQWNCIKVFLGTSTIKNIPFRSLSLKEVKILKQIFTFWPLSSFVLWIEKNESNIGRIDLLHKTYKEFFSASIGLKDKLIYQLVYVQIKYGIKLFSFLLNQKRKIKRRECL